MIINLRTLLHLPVYTESGTKLGTVFDLELDAEGHVIMKYFVKANFLSVKYFLIEKSLVKEITEDKIVVYDSVERGSLLEMPPNMALGE
ncbi:MAG: PRC-barrel domain-containing protein [Candidatus Magasanikbacteria bacterium]|nr:PRC-barrel domain-containing protein [Candidatus Magasanikbacteria bacterium]